MFPGWQLPSFFSIKGHEAVHQKKLCKVHFSLSNPNLCPKLSNFSRTVSHYTTSTSEWYLLVISSTLSRCMSFSCAGPRHVPGIVASESGQGVFFAHTTWGWFPYTFTMIPVRSEVTIIYPEHYIQAILKRFHSLFSLQGSGWGIWLSILSNVCRPADVCADNTCSGLDASIAALADLLGIGIYLFCKCSQYCMYCWIRIHIQHVFFVVKQTVQEVTVQTLRNQQPEMVW